MARLDPDTYRSLNASIARVQNPSTTLDEGVLGKIRKKLTRLGQTLTSRTGTPADRLRLAPLEKQLRKHNPKEFGSKSSLFRHEGAEYTAALEGALLALCEELGLDPQELLEDAMTGDRYRQIRAQMVQSKTANARKKDPNKAARLRAAFKKEIRSPHIYGRDGARVAATKSGITKWHPPYHESTLPNPSSRTSISEATEYILWGVPRGQTDQLYAQVLYTQGKTPADVAKVQRLAAAEGWHSFRVQRINLSEPWSAQDAFAGAVRKKPSTTKKSSRGKQP